MSELRPVWFLPRARDRSPAEAIRLGSIIASPQEPEDTINFTDPPEILPDKLRETEQPAWSWTKELPQSSEGGLLALFLSLTGIGSSTADTKHREIYAAERLVTNYFIPDKTYIAQSLEDPDVEYALTGPNCKQRVYMVTGIKTAYGATFAIETPRKPDTPAQNDAPINSESKEQYETGNISWQDVSASDHARVQNGNIIVHGTEARR